MTALVILCAGGSERFATGPKLLADLRGRPLVAWAIEHARDSGAGEVVVVVGAVDLSGVLGDEVVVTNGRWREGVATSLRAGIEAARRRGHDAVVVGLGDQPAVTPGAWAAVARATSPVAVAGYRGRRAPPVRLAAEVWPLLPTTGDAGARVLMAERPDLVEVVPVEGDPDDVDTPADLERIARAG